MYFQLLKVILWPRVPAEPRVVEFKTGVVNVISGASKTGKSAVVPIVDYCLGADKCAIPVGVIRESCAWFGIVVDTLEGQKLLARREPGDQQNTGDMVLIEAPTVVVPNQIFEKNTNVDAVKEALNKLAGLPGLAFDLDSEANFKSRPSFRDLVAFTFQPQNIIANPDVMFFKADTTEHREKLKTIFPYILGAITADVLMARFELDRLTRSLRRKETELGGILSATSAWRLEAQGWLRQGIEFGFLSPSTPVPENWLSIVGLLRQIVLSRSKLAVPSLEGADVVLDRLQVLRRKETEFAAQLMEHRQRLNELRRLREGSEAYGSAMLIQRDRLALADWLRDRLVDVKEPIVHLESGDRNRLIALCAALDGIEVRLRSHPNLSDTLDREVFRQREASGKVLNSLTEVRREVLLLERESELVRESVDQYDRAERFLGRLEQALLLYDQAEKNSTLSIEIIELRAQVDALQRTVSEREIGRKIRSALDTIQSSTGKLIPQLDAEWPDAPIRLVIKDLTVKIIRGTRDDYLWEIGSGANWLAYHVALTLALQRFFIAEVYHPVPGLLIYDQPSQVYFPKRSVFREEDRGEDIDWTDQDIVAVRKVFALFGSEVAVAGGRLQIIVLDHADEEVWGELPNVELTEEWRGRALVPIDWIS